MNYDLAKKLKDAGFPQKHSGTEWYYSTPERYGFVFVGQDISNLVKRPTLSELIDACGDRFASLENITDAETKNHFWIARPYWIDENHPAQHVTGNTPEEAVANLWLALNEKHD